VGAGALPGAASAASPASDGKPVDDRPWIGAFLVPMQRLHGGPLALLGLLAGVVFGGRARRYAIAGLLALGAVTAAYGWQAAPGEAELSPLATQHLHGVLSAGRLASLPGGAGGALAASAIVLALAAPGLAILFGRRPILAALALAVIPMENPRLAVPVTSLPPDPLRQTLSALDSGAVLRFPAPQAPFFQGQQPLARWFWEAAASGRATDGGPVRDGVPTAQASEQSTDDRARSSAAVTLALTRLTGIPVDTRAGEAFWSARDLDPFPAALTSGWRYLVVDLTAIPESTRAQLDGWLAARIGTPVVRDDQRLVYDLSAGPPHTSAP
jgi:hypothetical protein